MACSKRRNNLVLIPLWLLSLSLGSCKIPEEQKAPDYSVLTNSNRHWRHGKLFIGLKAEQDGSIKAATDNSDLDYQSDMGWDVHEQKMVAHGFQEYDKAAVERLLQMKPTVDCSGGHMRLQVKDSESKPGSLLFVDRGHLPPLSLSKLPKSCGYQVSSTHHNFDMIAPYDGCFVLVTDFCYVLPLRWFGLPVRLSCPVGLTSTTSESDVTPMVTCHHGGIVINTEWTSGIMVNLKNKWEPLAQVPAICSGTVTQSDSSTTVSFPYQSPCVEIKDGKHVVKMSGDVDVEVSCPQTPLVSSGFQQFAGQFGFTSAPTQHQKPTSSAPQLDMPQTPSPTGIHFHSWNKPQNPQQGIGNNGVGQSSYQIPGFNENLGQVYISHPDLPFMNVFEQGAGHQFQPGNPSVAMPPFEDSWLYWPPYNLPHEPMKPEVPPQPTGPLPEGSPTYPCVLLHSTAQPEVTTPAAPPATVPQHYRPQGPYYPPYSIPHLPHPTTTLTPSMQKPQGHHISRPGTAVVYPKHSQFEMQSLECLQYCQVGLLECCPQIAIHQHHYHFGPLQQNGNSQFPVFPPPAQPTGSRPDSLHVFSQGAQVASTPPSQPTATKAPFPPHFYQFGEQQGRQTYHRPQGGSPAAFHENKPVMQTDSSPAFFNPNPNYPPEFDLNRRNPPVQPEAHSARDPSPYFHFFNPGQVSNPFDPYNMPSSHQSDGTSSNMQSQNPLSRRNQYASQSANHANVKEPALLFGSPQLGPHGAVQEHISNRQPFDSLSRTHVLLQESPPGRESREFVPPSQYNQVIKNQYLARIFSKERLNFKESENSQRFAGENSGSAGPTAEENPELQPQSSSAESNSARLSENPDSSSYFKYPHELFQRFDSQRTSQQDATQ